MISRRRNIERLGKRWASRADLNGLLDSHVDTTPLMFSGTAISPASRRLRRRNAPTVVVKSLVFFDQKQFKTTR